jgi:hypothetical protein
MVKLALCFSGDTRTYNKCFDSIKNNLLDKFECDVFISTYDTNYETKNNILNLYKPKSYIFHNRDIISNTVSTHIRNLKPIKENIIGIHNLSFENIKNINKIEDCFFNYDKYEKNFVYNKLSVDALCQFFGIYDVSILCSKYMTHHNITYDYILRIRLDDIIYNTFTLYELNENEMLINTFHYYSDSIKFNDHFFMAKPETFFKISSLYNNIHNIIEIANNKKCWIPSSGYQETLLLIHILLNNITLKECSSNFCCIKLGFTFEDSKWKTLEYK